MKARDMARVYRHMHYDDCLELKSRKMIKIRQLEGKQRSYLEDQELRRIRFNLKQLEAEIACKEAQMELF